jgi:hypothetical protein
MQQSDSGIRHVPMLPSRPAGSEGFDNHLAFQNGAVCAISELSGWRGDHDADRIGRETVIG